MEKVSIQVEDGGTVRHQCIVTRGVWNDIKFPDVPVTEQLEDGADVTRLGSQVAFIDDPYRAQPIIFGVLSKQNETQLSEEDVFKIIKDNSGNYAVFSLDGKTASVNITTIGAAEGGDFNINITNVNETAALNLKVKGSINIDTTSDVNLVCDTDVNIQPTGTFNVGLENLEPILLGTKTVAELEVEVQALTDLITSIANIVPVVVPANAIDPTWAVWQVAVATIVNRGDYSAVKSDKSFTE
jgi:hypothetical protein